MGGLFLKTADHDSRRQLGSQGGPSPRRGPSALGSPTPPSKARTWLTGPAPAPRGRLGPASRRPACAHTDPYCSAQPPNFHLVLQYSLSEAPKPAPVGPTGVKTLTPTTLPCLLLRGERDGGGYSLGVSPQLPRASFEEAKCEQFQTRRAKGSRIHQ